MFVCLFVFCLFAISWAAPAAYGGSQARGLIGAVATGLLQSHSNTGSKPRLQSTPQLTATPDPQPTEQGQGLNPQPHGSSSDSLTTEPQRELLFLFFYFLFLFLFFVFLPFLGPLPQHMEVPRLGVKLELQLPAYTTATAMQDP